MNEPLTLKSIALKFIDRILNPTLENKAIGVFLMSGFFLMDFSQPFSIFGKIMLNLDILKVELSADNSPNWLMFSIGLALVTYGGVAFHRLKLFPRASRRGEIGELLQLIEQKTALSRNAQIQQFFMDLYKVSVPVPAIEKLLAADDPDARIRDYRFARQLVAVSNKQFVQVDPSADHRKRVSTLTRAYGGVSAVAVICMAAPLAPFIEAATREQLSVVGFPIAIAMGLVAACILNPIRAHAAAQRLLALPAGETQETRKDGETLFALLSEVHTTSFDNFVYYGRHHFIDDNILHYWEGFNGKISASNFHIHDKGIRTLVMELCTAWKKSLSFSSYFTDTRNGRLHKFDSRHDIHRDPVARAAHEAFAVAIEDADRHFRALLAAVREKFPAIEIDDTNAVALADYRSHQLEKI